MILDALHVDPATFARQTSWSLGPEAGGRALTEARAPDFALPDLAGRKFRLSALRGRKVLLVAWASW